jgi:SAM-dependent methyltransferase
LYDEAMSGRPHDDVDAWYAALEARHLSALTFAEVRRALQALSSLYVERRDRLGRGAALDGAGKRAAFALFYGPLHFLTVREIVRALHAVDPPPERVLDLGCGTAAAGAAIATAAGGQPAVSGIDGSGWAVGEAEWNLRALGLNGTARRGNLIEAPMGASGETIVAAYAVNELGDAGRAKLLPRLLAAHARGSRVLVVEAFRGAGGREDAWRFPAAFPERMRLLDKAASLDHQELTARSLWLGETRR